jgi:hypothetical protein
MGVELDRRDPGEEDLDLSAVDFAGQSLEDMDGSGLNVRSDREDLSSELSMLREEVKALTATTQTLQEQIETLTTQVKTGPKQEGAITLNIADIRQQIAETEAKYPEGQVTNVRLYPLDTLNTPFRDEKGIQCALLLTHNTCYRKFLNG